MNHDQIILLTVATILLVLTIAVVVVSSRHAPDPAVFRCAFCDQDQHVHDVTSGLCINRDCRCEEGR